MNGVERAEGLGGKWLPGALDDLRADPQYLPVGRGSAQLRAALGGVSFAESAERYPADQNPVALDEGQIGSDQSLRGGKCTAHLVSGPFLQQPGEDGT